MAIGTTNDVSFNRISAQFKEKWKVVRDVCSGDDAIRSDAMYLPFLNAHDHSPANMARNNAYRTRAVWYPACQFTLDGFLGLAFRVDPTNTLEGTPLEPLLNDVDGAGVSLYQQSQETLGNNLQVGRHGLYVDFAPALARPVIKGYRAESIINWKHESRDGQSVLVMVVLEETVEVEDGRYGLKEIKQWREVWLDREDGYCYFQLWREKTGDNGAPVEVNGQRVLEIMAQPDANKNNELQQFIMLRSRGKPLDFIPFVFIGARNNDGQSIDQPPMYGLAQLNVAHFRNSADYEDSVFFVGQVQPYITGLDDEWRKHLENPMQDIERRDADGNTYIDRVPTGQRLYVGSRTPILLPQHGTFGYAQANPNMLVGEAMKQKEEQMIAVGARMIEASAGGSRTATEDNNDREATTSVLSMCVSNVNEGYQRAIWMAAQFLDLGEAYDTADSYKINQDFVRTTAQPAIIAEMVKAWQTGVVAKDDVREYMRRVGMVPVERSNDDIDGDIESEGPRLGELGMGGAPIGGAPKLGMPARIPGSGTPGAANPNDSSGSNGGGALGNNDAGGMPSGGNPQPPAGNANDGGNAADSGTPNVIPIRRPAPNDPNIIDVEPREPRAPAQPAPVAPAMPDMQPLFTAMQTMMATMQSIVQQMANAQPQDMSGLVDAIRNMPAPNITISPAAITVESPQITVTPPSVTVEAPNVSLPNITTNVEGNRAGGKKVGRLIKTANGYDMEVSTVNDEGNS